MRSTRGQVPEPRWRRVDRNAKAGVSLMGASECGADKAKPSKRGGRANGSGHGRGYKKREKRKEK